MTPDSTEAIHCKTLALVGLGDEETEWDPWLDSFNQRICAPRTCGMAQRERAIRERERRRTEKKKEKEKGRLREPN